MGLVGMVGTGILGGGHVLLAGWGVRKDDVWIFGRILGAGRAGCGGSVCERERG